VSALGELLECLHRAGEGYRSVRAHYRTWRHQERATAAFQREAERRGGAVAVAVGSGPELPVEQEGFIRLWAEPPDRVREERDVAGGEHVAIRVGSSWWTYSPQTGALTNDPERNVSTSVGESLNAVLDPSKIMGLLELNPRGGRTRASRRALVADARPRPLPERDHHLSFGLHALGSGAQEYLLEVDAERGALLRVEARIGGEPFQVLEAVELAFDEPLPAGIFEFEPPAGESVRSVSEVHRGLDVSVREAAERAPFSVFVLPEVPAAWELRATFQPPDQRTSRPASVGLRYRANDASVGVRMKQCERAHGERLDLGWGSGTPPWQTLERNGIEMRLRARRGNWRQSQLRLDREDTAILMTSDQLNGDDLVELAARLVTFVP
jgi:outer membrane lipoprotein-sorting protein